MKISRQSWYAGVLGIILLLGVGCARKLNDAKMSSEIQSKFSQDSGLASKQLTVQANSGVVTLSGTTIFGGSFICSGSRGFDRKLTRAAISGRMPLVSSITLTLTRPVAFARFMRGPISTTDPR